MNNIEEKLFMLKMFRKSFWVPYEDGTSYPTVSKAKEAISKYCEDSGETCVFISDEEVKIGEKLYEIYRGYECGSRGNYGIKCTDK